MLFLKLFFTFQKHFFQGGLSINASNYFCVVLPYCFIIRIKKRYIATKKKFLQVFSTWQYTSVIYKDIVLFKSIYINMINKKLQSWY